MTRIEQHAGDGTASDDAKVENQPDDRPATAANPPTAEIGGREGPDPTRYGDWELRGRCIDF